MRGGRGCFNGGFTARTASGRGDLPAPGDDGEALAHGAEPADGGGLPPLSEDGKPRDLQVEEEFGQIRVEAEPGRGGQGALEVQAASRKDDAQAAEAGGGGHGSEGEEDALPEARMGEAAEVAGDGVGLAVFLGELVPGAVGGGDAEDGVEMRAVVAGTAACAAMGVEDEGGESGPFGIGEGTVEDAEGRGHFSYLGK